ncbi:MAG: hypothetical protein QXW97_01020, partial [Candidatus Pacearchaeota archaeon]
AILEKNTGKFYWKPNENQEGEHIITINVTDGKIKDSAKFSIRVSKKVINMNDTPRPISPIEPSSENKTKDSKDITKEIKNNYGILGLVIFWIIIIILILIIIITTMIIAILITRKLNKKN